MTRNHQSIRQSRVLLACCALLIGVVFAACGSKRVEEDTGANMGKTEKAFRLAAKQSGIPERLLIAAAYVESGLRPEASSAVYINPSTPDAPVSKGLRLGQTAVGISRAELGIEGKPDAGTLETQLIAYGQWVRARLDAKKLTMDKSLSSIESQIQWVWQLAQLHRSGKDQRRNIRVVFARELIDTLNNGFLWQDPATGDTLRFAPNSRKIDIERQSIEIRKMLTPSTDRSDIGSRAVLFEMPVIGSGGVKNNPRRIEVVHCPLSLSGCLEIQNPSESGDDQVRLGAHYLIPRDETIVDRVLQVHPHDDTIETLNAQGDVAQVSDAIVIMLVGNSGRYVDGRRVQADPTWFTAKQMETMGKVIRDICTRLEETHQVDAAKCAKPFSPDGVMFRTQGVSEAYQWGQVADFDRVIFGAYTRDPDGLQGETAMRTPSNRRAFRAGASIRMQLRFPLDSKLVEMERLVRCPDSRLVWSLVESMPTLSMTRLNVGEQLWDAGPNGDGAQFYRVLAYDDRGGLLGWSIDSLFIQGFMKDAITAPPKACM